MSRSNTSGREQAAEECTAAGSTEDNMNEAQDPSATQHLPPQLDLRPRHLEHRLIFQDMLRVSMREVQERISKRERAAVALFEKRFPTSVTPSQYLRSQPKYAPTEPIRIYDDYIQAYGVASSHPRYNQGIPQYQAVKAAPQAPPSTGPYSTPNAQHPQATSDICIKHYPMAYNSSQPAPSGYAYAPRGGRSSAGVASQHFDMYADEGRFNFRWPGAAYVDEWRRQL